MGRAYDCDVIDLFAGAGGCHRRIVDALKVTSARPKKRGLPTSEACNVEAYDYFMRGREFLLRGKQEP